MRHAQACAGYHAQRARLGIPEPPRLDPLCGVASLAACLRSLALPYDRATLLRACRVTGEGSSLGDVLNAGRKLGLNARTVTADDLGLMALPKPLVAYVEHDHFVALVRADRAGVSYLCSDCGPWPGGRVDLTWAQWHALDAGPYLAVMRRGGAADALVRAALAAPLKNGNQQKASDVPPLRLSYAGPLSALHMNFHVSAPMLARLKGHILDYVGFHVGYASTLCGQKPESLHHPGYIHCPMTSPSPSCHGPTAGEPVNLATGEEEYAPEADLIVPCPISGSGPRNTLPVVWGRIYNSLRPPDQSGLSAGNGLQYYESADFGVGWSHPYNIRIYDPTGGNGFQVSTKWLVLPNGARIAINATAAPNPTYGTPGTCTVGAGVPYNVQWTAGGQFIVTLPDRTTWTFMQLATNPQGYTDYSQYLLYRIADRDGHPLIFGYNPGGLLSTIGGGGSFPLLTLYRNTDGSNSIDHVVDIYGHVVYYRETTVTNTTPSYAPGPANHTWVELTNVSRVISDGSATPFPAPGGNTFNAASRWCYGYTLVATGDTGGGVNQAFACLSTIQVPSPATPTSTATYSQATIAYQPVTCAVSQITDANGVQTLISPASGSQTTVQTVQPIGNSLVTIKTQTYGFDLSMHQTSLTDFNNSVVARYTFADANNPNQPSSVTDANGNTWGYAWDAYGNLHQSTDPRGVVTKYAWAYRNTPLPSGATSADVQAASAPALGELRSVKEGSRTTTRLDYWEPSGHVNHLYSPKPDTTGTANSDGPTVTTTYVYDSVETGNLLSITTPGNSATVVNGVDQGITTTLNYSDDFTCNQSGDPSASGYHVTEIRWGLPLTVTEATTDGSTLRVSHFRYDQERHPVIAVDASGNKTTFSYVLQNSYNSSLLSDQIQQVTFPATSQTGTGQGYTKYAYQYDGGPLTSTILYDESGSVVNGNGTGGVAVRQTSQGYGPEGELRSLSGSVEPVQYVYDGLYRISSLTDGNGHSTNHYYNAAGYLDSLTYPGYIGSAFPSVSGPDSLHFIYDAAGNLTKRFDGNGVETDYQRVIPGTSTNEPGSLVRTVHYPGGATADVGLSYDAYGRLTTMADGTGTTTYGPGALTGYDDLDNPLNVQTAYAGLPAQLVQYNHWDDGSRHTMTVPGRTYAYGFDKAGRFTNLANNFGEAVAWSYQSNNWPSSQIDSNGSAVLSAYAGHNALGQLTYLQNVSATGALLSEFGDPNPGRGISHDAVGNTLSVTSYLPAEGNLTTNYAYDSRDQLTQESSGRGGSFINTFGYDLAGNPTDIRGVENPAYNVNNQTTTPSGINPAFGSDGNGNPGAAHGAALAFDPENRLTQASAQTASVPTRIAVGSDGLIRLLWNNADGSMTLQLVNATNGSAGPKVSYGPYPGWTAVSVAVGSNGATRVLWNNSGGQISIWNMNDPQPTATCILKGPYPGWTALSIAVGPDNTVHILWNHAPDNMMSLGTIDNATGAYSGPVYGPFPGWTARDLTVDAGNTIHVLWNNLDGRISLWNMADAQPQYTCLIYGPSPGWTGQSVAAGPASDPRIHLQWSTTAGQGALWTINADGSIVPTPAPNFGPYAGWYPVQLALGSDNVTRLLWSNVNGTASIWNVGSDNSTYTILPPLTLTPTTVAGTGAAFGYRGDGLRAWKQTASGARTYYLYDGDQPVCELNGSGTVTAETMFGAWGVVSRNTGSGTTFYAFDERGNVAQRTNGSGAVTSTDLYDAYGQKRAGPADVFGFGGQAGYYTDAETGLVLCTNRHYDPQQGRFLTRDPSGYDGGINLYGYTQNNPVNGMDPDGLDLVPAPGSTPGFINQFNQAINDLKSYPPAKKVIDELTKPGTKYTVQFLPAESNAYGASFDDRSNTVYWDPTASFLLDTKGSLSPDLILGHELDHAYHYDQDRALAKSMFGQKTYNDWDNKEEARTIIYFENPAAEFFHNGIRHDHRYKYKGSDPRNIVHVKNPATCAR